MPSVVGLLEKRELAARERVESLREQADRLLAELRGAEADWERFVIAREAVGEVLSASDGPDAGEMAGSPVVPAASAVPTPAEAVPVGAVAGSVVPVRRRDCRSVCWRPTTSGS